MLEQGLHLADYRIVQLLGRDEDVDVYLGKHLFLETLVTLRLFRFALSEQDILACQREALVLSGLAHPNIERVLDSGAHDGRFYLAAEYVPEQTLALEYPPGTRLEPKKLLSLLQPLVSALQYAHSQNVIHGQITAENILVGLADELVLSNFSLSPLFRLRMARASSPSKALFLAPEAYDGQFQRSIDQYALAGLARMWLNGEQTPALLPAQSVESSSIAPEIDTVLKIALERDPSRRFHSVQAFFSALALVCGNPTVADSTGTGLLNQPGRAISTTPSIEQIKEPQTLPSWNSSPTWNAASSLPTNQVEATSPGMFLAEQNRVPLPVLTTLPPETPPFGNDSLPWGETTATLLPEKGLRRKRTTRRALLAGVGGMLVVLVGGAVVLDRSGRFSFLSAHSSATPTHTSTQAPVPTPTEEPPTPDPVSENIGTTLTTYTDQTSDVTGVGWEPGASNRVIASCSQDGIVSIWGALDGVLAEAFPRVSALSTLVWSPNGQYIAIGGADKTVQIWEVASMSVGTTCTGHTQTVLGLAWSPDGQRIVSTSQDQTAIVWEASTGNRLVTFTGHTDYVWTVSWSPDGNSIATGSWDQTVQIWDPENGSLKMRYTATQEVRAVDWSPDSTLIASGGNDNSIQIWQASNGSILTTYTDHTDHIEAIQWSPDGQRIASASRDTTVQIWQASNGSPIYTYTGHTELVWALAWSADGQLIVSGSQDQTARVWQAS